MDHIQVLVAHINNYLYELRSNGKEAYAAKVQAEVQGVLREIENANRQPATLPGAAGVGEEEGAGTSDG